KSELPCVDLLGERARGVAVWVELRLAQQMVGPEARDLRGCLGALVQRARQRIAAHLERLGPCAHRALPMLIGEDADRRRASGLDLAESTAEPGHGLELVPGLVVGLAGFPRVVVRDENPDRGCSGEKEARLPVALDELVEDGLLLDRTDRDLG